MTESSRLEQDERVGYSITVQLSPDVSDLIDEIMERQGLGLSDAVSTAVRFYAARAAREHVRQLPVILNALTRGGSANVAHSPLRARHTPRPSRASEDASPA